MSEIREILSGKNLFGAHYIKHQFIGRLEAGENLHVKRRAVRIVTSPGAERDDSIKDPGQHGKQTS